MEMGAATLRVLGQGSPQGPRQGPRRAGGPLRDLAKPKGRRRHQHQRGVSAPNRADGRTVPVNETVHPLTKEFLINHGTHLSRPRVRERPTRVSLFTEGATEATGVAGEGPPASLLAFRVPSPPFSSALSASRPFPRPPTSRGDGRSSRLRPAEAGHRRPGLRPLGV